MNLTDLKLTKQDKKKLNSEVPQRTDSKQEYPYGASINLDTRSLSKLGLDLKSFQVGQKVKIVAECSVIEIRQSKDLYDESQNLGIQVQKLGIYKGKSKMGKFNDMQKRGPG